MPARSPSESMPGASRQTPAPGIAVVGNSGSGKTTLCTQLVADISARGYRIAVVKHCPHGHDVDRRGADSQRIFEAGAVATVAFSPDKITRVERPSPETKIETLVGELNREYDLVVVEGFKNLDLPKILVDDGAPPFVDDVIATVTLPEREADSAQPPAFPAGQVTALASLVLTRLG
jgi:molybdopterin-guanine dinucleotide biosynthesis adapter protein